MAKNLFKKIILYPVPPQSLSPDTVLSFASVLPYPDMVVHCWYAEAVGSLFQVQCWQAGFCLQTSLQAFQEVTSNVFSAFSRDWVLTLSEGQDSSPPV